MGHASVVASIHRRYRCDPSVQSACPRLTGSPPSERKRQPCSAGSVSRRTRGWPFPRQIACRSRPRRNYGTTAPSHRPMAQKPKEPLGSLHGPTLWCGVARRREQDSHRGRDAQVARLPPTRSRHCRICRQTRPGINLCPQTRQARQHTASSRSTRVAHQLAPIARTASLKS